MKAAVLLVAACGADPGPIVESHLLIDGTDQTNTDCRTGMCVHDENTDLTSYAGATWLVHRTAESQVLGPNSSLRVYRSDDHGATWSQPAVIPAPTDRDLRDPSFYVDASGMLNLKAITRLPVNSTRDSDVDSITVHTSSADGITWSPLVPIGPEQWSFWRVKPDLDGTLYAAAYEDGDRAVKLFSSTDGVTWTPGAMIYDVAEDTPLETELMFDAAGVTAYVRMDGTDDELLGSSGRLRTKVCTATAPYTSFSCANELTGVRLDGPVGFDYNGKRYVVARKHFLEVENRKRTALYQIDGLGWTELGEFPSTGDTSYAGVVPIDDHGGFLVTYYSSPIDIDGPWARAMFGPTDIWQAKIQL